MKIGLYSEMARRNVVQGRELIAKKRYTTTAEDIRRCRQDIIRDAEKGNQNMAKLIDHNDFFSLSECRDLLFHVQEHRFTLPQIKIALREFGLKFLGFELRDQTVMTQFKSLFGENAGSSLSSWHEFETNNPDTFKSMYQFWVQKGS